MFPKYRNLTNDGDVAPVFFQERYLLIKGNFIHLLFYLIRPDTRKTPILRLIGHLLHAARVPLRWRATKPSSGVLSRLSHLHLYSISEEDVRRRPEKGQEGVADQGALDQGGANANRCRCARLPADYMVDLLGRW